VLFDIPLLFAEAKINVVPEARLVDGAPERPPVRMVTGPPVHGVGWWSPLGG
jgi:hypothetical protein